MQFRDMPHPAEKSLKDKHPWMYSGMTFKIMFLSQYTQKPYFGRANRLILPLLDSLMRETIQSPTIGADSGIGGVR